jgi:four helix bundle protein
MNKKDFNLENRLPEYSAQIIHLVDRLDRSFTARHIGSQLLRSGTSPLFNHGEAQGAESQNDFIHKMGICLKELRESRRALLLIKKVPLSKYPDMIEAALTETEELIRIFFTSIRTAKTNIVREDHSSYLEVEC